METRGAGWCCAAHRRAAGSTLSEALRRSAPTGDVGPAARLAATAPLVERVAAAALALELGLVPVVAACAAWEDAAAGKLPADGAAAADGDRLRRRT